MLIESCINSYVDEKGIQKNFNTEIDFMYPPDVNLFYSYLQELVNQSINWLITSSSHILESIVHYDKSRMREFATVAAKTNFNLKEKSEYHFPIEDQKKQEEKVIQSLENNNINKELIDFIKQQFDNH